jgi:hypothetical protein
MKELSGCGSAEASYDRQPERSNKTGNTGRAAAPIRSSGRAARIARPGLAKKPARQRFEIFRKRPANRRVPHQPTFTRTLNVRLHIPELLQISKSKPGCCRADARVLGDFRLRGIRGAHQVAEHQSARGAIDAFPRARSVVRYRRRIHPGWHVHILPDTARSLREVDRSRRAVRTPQLTCQSNCEAACRDPRSGASVTVEVGVDRSFPVGSGPDGSTSCIATQSVEE